jgi:hypothetical protein
MPVGSRRGDRREMFCSSVVRLECGYAWMCLRSNAFERV